MAHPIRLLPATLAAVLLLLAGCSATPDSGAIPTADTTRDSTASSSSAPTSAAPITPTPPTLPEAATRNDDAGQLAFIQHWWNLYNYAYATGDPGPLMAVSDPSDPSNSAIQKDVNRGHSEGRSVEGGGYTVVATVRVEVDAHGVTSPTVTVQRAAGIIVTNGDREPFPAGRPEDIGMVLVWEGDHWQMAGRGRL